MWQSGGSQRNEKDEISRFFTVYPPPPHKPETLGSVDNLNIQWRGPNIQIAIEMILEQLTSDWAGGNYTQRSLFVEIKYQLYYVQV